MRLLLLLFIPLLFTACDTSTKSYNDIVAAMEGTYSIECINYSMPYFRSNKVTQTGLIMLMTKLEGCKTREMLDNFAS